MWDHKLEEKRKPQIKTNGDALLNAWANLGLLTYMCTKNYKRKSNYFSSVSLYSNITVPLHYVTVTDFTKDKTNSILLELLEYIPPLIRQRMWFHPLNVEKQF